MNLIAVLFPFEAITGSHQAEREPVAVFPGDHRLPEPADDVQNETDDNADDDARDQREIECEVPSLNQDIARELA